MSHEEERGLVIGYLKPDDEVLDQTLPFARIENADRVSGRRIDFPPTPAFTVCEATRHSGQDQDAAATYTATSQVTTSGWKFNGG